MNSRLNSNKVNYPNYSSNRTVLLTGNGDTTETLIIEKEGYIGVQCSCAAANTNFFARLTINGFVLFAAYGGTHDYDYLTSALYPVKVGDTVKAEFAKATNFYNVYHLLPL